ncbi:MAG: hypothetical protein IKG70_09955 [Lachnospiraceae bacterium]|nr:hypothetical protein [Lachnospiraceae bacterium]
MDKSNLIKALVNLVLSWLLVAVVLCIKYHISFGAALTRPYTIIIAIVAGVASYVGLMIRKNR